MHKHQLFFSHLQLYKQSAINGNIHRLGGRKHQISCGYTFHKFDIDDFLTWGSGFLVFKAGYGV